MNAKAQGQVRLSAKYDSSDNVYTVSRLNREIRTILESRYPSFWVEGEISNFKHHSSGHMYLTLKDQTSQISAVFFSRQNAGLKFKLKDGLKVLIHGRVSLYEPRGQYQIYIENIEPQGLGALQLAFIQLKEKLHKEGLFETFRKRPIPLFPQTVGVITSPTGAAIRDILNVVNRRFRGTTVLLSPVRVQGTEAAGEISQAIREMNNFRDVDVLIVGRGGGSLEDLWAFNEEVVARAIFESRIPVISAVGHEVDWTISDMVADLRAPTPSAAAELVVQNREDLLRRVQNLDQRSKQGLVRLIEGAKARLDALSSSYALRQPEHLVQQYSQRVDELNRQLQQCVRRIWTEKNHFFHNSVAGLEALSPLAVLNRGYSLTEAEGKLITNIKQVRTGELIETRLKMGRIRSRVESLIKEENNEPGS